MRYQWAKPRSSAHWPKQAVGHDPREKHMTITRRHILAGAIAAPAVLAGSRRASSAVRTVKISHQFPGGTATEGDFRDRLCRQFAAELEKRTNGSMIGQVYPNSSLMKTVAQFSA